MKVAVALIDVVDRLRGAAPEQVANLATSMAEVGLLSPITVHAREIVRGGIAAPGFGLVAGLHRLEAARSLGWLEIDAHVVDLPDLRRQLAECDENLCGTKLTPSDRALFTRRRKEIYEALHPETRNGSSGAGRPKVRQLGEAADRFTADTAARTGRSERDVQRDATRGERIPAPLLAEVRGTALDKGTVLDRLARAEDAGAELARLRATPALPPDETEAQIARLMSAWRAADPAARTEFLKRIGTSA